MKLPTASEITNYYLYGTPRQPDNKADCDLIRLDSKDLSKYLHISIDASEYMQGPGRFALAALSDLVQRFFSSAPISEQFWGKEYSKQEMLELFNLNTDREYSFAINIKQYNYKDNKNDYAERVYIWNSTAFKLRDGTRFVIDSDGTRHIKNISVVPRYYINSSPTDETKKENFDF